MLRQYRESVARDPALARQLDSLARTVGKLVFDTATAKRRCAETDPANEELRR
jgi:hypothetical protein